jgi:SMC interacting uncharacterized protein involved in chromosome segregation
MAKANPSPTAKELRAALTEVAHTLDASTKQRTSDARELIEALESPEARALAEEVRALTQPLASGTEEAHAQLEQAKALRESHREAIAQLRKDVDAIAKLVREPPERE